MEFQEVNTAAEEYQSNLDTPTRTYSMTHIENAFIAGAFWMQQQLDKHKELTLILDNGEIKPAADGK